MKFFLNADFDVKEAYKYKRIADDVSAWCIGALHDTIM